MSPWFPEVVVRLSLRSFQGWIALVLLPVLPLVAAGCVYPFDPQDGTVFIEVNTEAGQPVAGVKATLVDHGGSIMNGLEGRTNSRGEIRWTGAPVGEWRVRLDLPQGYSFAPGQAHPVAVRVRDGKETPVQITLSGPS